MVGKLPPYNRRDRVKLNLFSWKQVNKLHPSDKIINNTTFMSYRGIQEEDKKEAQLA